MERNSKDVEQILLDLKEGKTKGISDIHRLYFAGLLSFVARNNGNDEDAKDLFQECIFYLFRSVSEKEGLFIDNLDAYFQGMYRRRWFHFLKKRKQDHTLKEDYQQETSENEEDIYYLIYLRAFRLLGVDCQKVLEAYVEGKKTEEIADMLDTSRDYAKRKKYLCKENLKKIAAKLLRESE